MIFNAKQLPGLQTVHIFTERYFETGINPFPVNAPFMNKPGSWFLIAKFMNKHLSKSDILRKNVTLAQVFFTHFASTNQLPCFIHPWNIGTLAENWLKTVRFLVHYASINHSSKPNLYWFPPLVIWKYHSQLSMSYCLHLAYIYFDHLLFETCFQNINKWPSRSLFSHIAGKILIVVPFLSYWNSYFTW